MLQLQAYPRVTRILKATCPDTNSKGICQSVPKTQNLISFVRAKTTDIRDEFGYSTNLEPLQTPSKGLDNTESR